ncbi:MAG: putative metal-binding motif-containing protein, partial [Myxococcota bacterium]
MAAQKTVFVCIYVAGQSRIIMYEQDMVVTAQLVLTPDFVGADADEDGFLRCQAGSVVEGCDCDDRDGLVNPFTAEICGDDVDNDCSGGFPPDGSGCPCTEDVPCTNLDEAFVASAGLGACTLGVLRCVDGALSDTCEGASPIRNPGAETELPGNFIDDDCDGVVDEGGPCEPAEFPNGRVCHRGFVDDPNNTEVAEIFSSVLAGIDVPGQQASFLAAGICRPGGNVPGRQSCDPSTRTWGLVCSGDILPQRPPLPDEIDNVEPGGAVDISAFTGVGFVELRLSGVVDLDGNPVDQCDGIDNNCDGSFDESPSFDSDGDGYTRCGTPVRFETEGESSTVVRDTEGLEDTFIDCNDSNPDINPGAREICSDSLDNNCFCDHGDAVGLPRFTVPGAFNCSAEDSVLDCTREGPRSDPTVAGFACGDTGDGNPAYYWGYRDNPGTGERGCYLSDVRFGVSCAEDGACGTKENDCCPSPRFPEPNEDRLTETRPFCTEPRDGSCTCDIPAAWDPLPAGEDDFDDCAGFACTGYFWGIEDDECFL